MKPCSIPIAGIVLLSLQAVAGGADQSPTDADRLCIVWDDKPAKQNCWTVIFGQQGAVDLTWKGKPKARIERMVPGNTLGF